MYIVIFQLCTIERADAVSGVTSENTRFLVFPISLNLVDVFYFNGKRLYLFYASPIKICKKNKIIYFIFSLIGKICSLNHFGLYTQKEKKITDRSL